MGLASRAPLTFFDEPYLGLDAVARSIFYDRLLEDYAEHPRTIVLSTHLIDEVANLLEHIVLIDAGRILLDQDADEVRAKATTVAGRRTAVEEFAAGRTVISRDGIGGLATVTLDGPINESERRQASELGLELAPVSCNNSSSTSPAPRSSAPSRKAPRGSPRRCSRIEYEYDLDPSPRCCLAHRAPALRQPLDFLRRALGYHGHRLGNLDGRRRDRALGRRRRLRHGRRDAL